MHSLAILIGLYAREQLQQRFFYGYTLAAAAVMLLAPQAAFFNLGEAPKMAADLGLSTLLVAAAALAVLSSRIAPPEDAGFSALSVTLTTPVPRAALLLARWLAGALVTGLFCLLLAPVLLFSVRVAIGADEMPGANADPVAIAVPVCVAGVIALLAGLLLYYVARQPRFSALGALFAGSVGLCLAATFFAGEWFWPLLWGIAFAWLHAALCGAFSIAASACLPAPAALLTTAGFFLAGHAAPGLLAGFRPAGQWTAVGSLFRALLPDLNAFNLTDSLAYDVSRGAAHLPRALLQAPVYAAIYAAALLCIGHYFFARREA